MKISYDYYNVFYYVARYKSISKAAKVLSNSQPNITRIIGKLEDALGCKLFIRTNKGVVLTEQGGALYYYVKEAHHQIALGEAMVNDITNSGNSTVYIGIAIDITNNFIQSLILPSISSFHQDHPNTHLQIINDFTPKLITDLNNGSIDIAILTSSDFDIHESQKASILYSFNDVIIAGNSYREIFKEPVTLKDVCRHPIVGLGKHTETYAIYDRFFAEKGLEFSLNIETATTEQTLSFVEDNLGIGCVSSNYAYPAIDEGRIIEVRLKEKLPRRMIAMVRNEQSPNPTAAILEEYITGHIREYGEQS